MLVRPFDDQWPELTAPFLVVALQGWVDAGSSAQLAVATLRSAWHLERIGVFDLDEFLDYQHRRPSVRLDEDGRRRIEWQEIEFLAGFAGSRHAVVLTGPEPARAWPSFIGAVVDSALTLRIQQVFALGGIPTPVAHTQPPGLAMTTSSPDLAKRYETLLGPYEGPTGMQTALQVAFGEVGIPAVSLWAQVPHYLSPTVWPGGSVALLRQLMTDTGTQAPLDDLVQADAQRRAEVDRAVTERPDIQALVGLLEQGSMVEELPTGDEIAAEIERFLEGEQP